MTAIHSTASREGFRRDTLPWIADGLAAAVAASLPWSTSATGILVGLWLVAVLPRLDLAALLAECRSPPGGLAVLLAVAGVVGLCWGEAPFAERMRGLEPFLRLLAIPVLLAQFRRSDRGLWVGYAFLASAALLLLVSYGMLVLEVGDIGHGYWVPVKDYITQSGVFALSAIALFDAAMRQRAERRYGWAAAGLALAALFVTNIVYVTTGRTTLVVMVAAALLWGWCRLSRRPFVLFLAAGLVLGAIAWTTSPYLRSRVTGIASEITDYEEAGLETSAGSRLEFWRSSLRALSEAPVWGHGTGEISASFRRLAEPSATNPHNQIFAVGIQLGAVGIAMLLAMWAAHWRLFRRPGLAAWIGLAAVTQNIVGSLFNSHLSDFTQAWTYVFAVGVFGGSVLRRQDAEPPSAPRPAAGAG